MKRLTHRIRQKYRKAEAILLSFFCLIAFFSACTPRQDTTDYLQEPDENQRLSICTSIPSAVYEPIVREFEARTGIWVTVDTGGSLELLQKISDAGDSSWDIILGGGLDSLEAHRGLFSSYRSPLLNAAAPSYLPEEDCLTPFSVVPLVLVYNPKLARIHPPSGFDSLLDAAWKGRIAFADPAISGTSYTVLASLLQILPGDDTELLRSFAANLDGQLLSHSSDVIREVANGNCYIGMVGEDDALRAMDAGYDIAVVYPVEGTCAIADGAAILKDCAHEENARLFIDFLLSQDVQTYIETACLRRSVLDGSLRESLGTDETSQDTWQGNNSSDRLFSDYSDDFVQFSYDIALSAGRQEETLRIWQKIWEEENP